MTSAEMLRIALLSTTLADEVLALVHQMQQQDPIALEEVGTHLAAARQRLQEALHAPEAAPVAPPRTRREN